jgi:hypothetical protein
MFVRLGGLQDAHTILRRRQAKSRLGGPREVEQVSTGLSVRLGLVNEHRVYASGVGLVKDGSLVLVSYDPASQ